MWEKGDSVWFSRHQQMLPAANVIIQHKWEVNSHSVDSVTQFKNTKWHLMTAHLCFGTHLHDQEPQTTAACKPDHFVIMGQHLSPWPFELILKHESILDFKLHIISVFYKLFTRPSECSPRHCLVCSAKWNCWLPMIFFFFAKINHLEISAVFGMKRYLPKCWWNSSSYTRMQAYKL